MKQAIVMIHGMGEQIPMATLNSFVSAVWTEDTSLVPRDRKDPRTGKPRQDNASWAKPDERNSSTELRRIRTEQDARENYTDFYEYYWAHMMQGTRWEHLSAWLKDLLWRNPIKRVPKRVLHAWILLWIITLAVLAFWIWGFWPKAQDPKPWRAVFSAFLGLAVSGFVSEVLLKRFGDVARYVKALPANVAKRHEIRKGGVELLDRLISSGEYERIIIVAHSLGSIVAYDILSMLYAKHNEKFAKPENQPERHKLEEMIRDALDGNNFSIDEFQDQQTEAFKEARLQGSSWIISDFITLGSPLTHAEFLMAESHEDLRNRQKARLLPTCPPALEYDGTTKLFHFSYSNEDERTPEDFRTPHYGALFAFTRWTNIFSQERAIVKGDIISGPLCEVFGVDGKAGVVSGIRDIAVLPALDVYGRRAEGHRRAFITHNDYWRLDEGTETKLVEIPHHIAELRDALKILQ